MSVASLLPSWKLISPLMGVNGKRPPRVPPIPGPGRRSQIKPSQPYFTTFQRVPSAESSSTTPFSARASRIASAAPKSLASRASFRRRI